MEHPQSTAVTLVQLAAQPGISIRGTVPVAELGQHHGARLDALAAFLRQRGIAAAGPPWVRYHTFGETETDVEVGVPVASPVAADEPIRAVELPSGPAIMTGHAGAHDRLGEAYARVGAWLNASGREPAGPGWEVYHWIDLSGAQPHGQMPAPETWYTELVQPLAVADDAHA